MPKIKLAVFASGRGSNFRALVEACREGRLDAEFVLLLASSDDAGALDLAGAYDIPAVALPRGRFASRAEFVAAMQDELIRSGADWIALAGYMKKIPPEIIKAFPQRIMNIHPGLLPAFGGQGMYGHHVHQAVLDAGCKVSGVTIHLVDGQYDHGPIVAQETVPVLPGDDAGVLAARVLNLEHSLYSRVMQAAAQGRVQVQGRKAWIEESLS